MTQQARIYEDSDANFATGLVTYLGTLTIATGTQPCISKINGGSRPRVLITYRDV
jgi:hypothetical protein